MDYSYQFNYLIGDRLHSIEEGFQGSEHGLESVLKWRRSVWNSQSRRAPAF